MSTSINPSVATQAAAQPQIAPPTHQAPPPADLQPIPAPTRQNPTESDTPKDTTPEPIDPTRQNPTDSDTQSAPPPNLTHRQQTAITLLLAGHTMTSVAANLGLHRSTLYEWKRQSDFMQELNRRHQEIRRASDARLRLLLLQSTQAALDSLKKKRPDRHQNAFRLLTVLRPFLPVLNQPEPPFADAQLTPETGETHKNP